VRTGSALAGYRFDSLIGEGAMGAVCLAAQPAADADVTAVDEGEDGLAASCAQRARFVHVAMRKPLDR
jgi:hypothetical protein